MTTHEVLVKARNHIVRHGWTRRQFGRCGAPTCAHGALMAVAPQDDDGDNYRAYGAAYIVLGDIVGQDVWAWNDRQVSPAPILAAFDKAIAETAPAPDLSFIAEQEIVAA